MVDFPVTVPDVAGVPPVLFSGLLGAGVSMLTADAYSLVGSISGKSYGFFLAGVPVIVSDNVIDMTYRQDWLISDYPIEQGAFASYNKVQTPYDVRLRFSTGGSSTRKQLLLNSIAAIASTTLLFDAVTPEAVYPNVNIKHYDYRRTATSGAGLLTVDVWGQQVRVASALGFLNTLMPSGASLLSGGTVQAVLSSTASELSALLGFT